MEEDGAGEAGGDNKKRIVDLLLTMGVEQAMAVQAVHDVYSEGKVDTAGQSLQSVVGQILDKVAAAQRRQKHEVKEAAMDDGSEVEEQKLPRRPPQPPTPVLHKPAAPVASPQRGGLYPALDNTCLSGSMCHRRPSTSFHRRLLPARFPAHPSHTRLRLRLLHPLRMLLRHHPAVNRRFIPLSRSRFVRLLLRHCPFQLARRRPCRQLRCPPRRLSVQHRLQR